MLTNDITRLVSEIRASRGTRKALINDLMHLTKSRRASVAAMQAGFQGAHAEMARKVKGELSAFVSGVRRTVFALRREIAGDITGAHRAWSGRR